MSEALDRLERAGSRLGEVDARARAVSLGPAPDDAMRAGLAHARARLDQLRGSLAQMREQPSPLGETNEARELASLSRALHLQQVGSATALASMEKKLRQARRELHAKHEAGAIHCSGDGAGEARSALPAQENTSATAAGNADGLASVPAGVRDAAWDPHSGFERSWRDRI